MQSRREWIVDQLPVTVLALERNASHVQVAIADVADGDCALGAAAGPYSAEAHRARHGELAGGTVGV